MLHTARKALYRLVSTVACRLPCQGWDTPTAIMTIRTAEKTLRKAVDLVSTETDRKDFAIAQAMDRYDTLAEVRGMQRI